MKYEVGKTYTLTGDETHYLGCTLRDFYPSTEICFPEEAVYQGVDVDRDLTFVTEEGWVVHLKNTETETDFDVVDKPEHYNTNLPEGIEVIDIIAAQTADLSGIRAVCQANLIKYTLRWQKKNGVEDLKKARAYIDRLIGELS